MAQKNTDERSDSGLGAGVLCYGEFTARRGCLGPYCQARPAETKPVETGGTKFKIDHIHLEARGAEVLLPVTVAGSGNETSYIKGPDNVRTELVQPQ